MPAAARRILFPLSIIGLISSLASSLRKIGRKCVSELSLQTEAEHCDIGLVILPWHVRIQAFAPHLAAQREHAIEPIGKRRAVGPAIVNAVRAAILILPVAAEQRADEPAAERMIDREFALARKHAGRTRGDALVDRAVHVELHLRERARLPDKRRVDQEARNVRQCRIVVAPRHVTEADLALQKFAIENKARFGLVAVRSL